MRVHVLGTAAGGGVPQWNCACERCRAARDGRIPRRLEASIAVSPDGGRWFIFNATGDVRAQLDTTPDLAPRARRESSIRGVFLTDANMDHTTGLGLFRQAARFQTYSTSVVRDVLARDGTAFALFAKGEKRWDLVQDAPVRIEGASSDRWIDVRAIDVPGLLPSYAGGARVRGAAVAYELRDDSGASLVYAPVFLDVCDALVDAVERADAALLDGSFYTDGEMIEQGLSNRSAREMGHLPVSGPGGSLAAFRPRTGAVVCYTHINNTNPMLDPQSPACAAVLGAGFSIPYDGMVLELRADQAQVRTRA